ncbi:MAG: hypothetical protein M1823_009054, partial [Watsoniomyces obsoletus]
MRLNTELDQLRSKQLTGSESRDKELTSAKNKVVRLETRVKVLEDQLDNQSRAAASPAHDLSGLRDDLAESRKKEAAAIKRETELKSANRDCKMQINDLERELHEARLERYKSTS